MVENLKTFFKNATLYDISMPIEPSMTVYKNKGFKKPRFHTVASYEKGQHFETEITMNIHTGSHIDAPLHMIDGGHTMETYALDRFIGPCRVIDFTNLETSIKKEDLQGKTIKKGDTLLFKTKNSSDAFFNYDFIYLEKSGAEYLAEIGINGVGIDALGIERAQSDHSTHKALLSQNIYILEGLRLRDVPEGDYVLIALPLNLVDVEGSFTRPVLLK